MTENFIVESFPDEINLNIKIHEDDPEYLNCLAINDPFPNNSYEDNWMINVYLNEFNYRKNVDYKKVAKDVNDYFLIEYICSIVRKNNDYYDAPCVKHFKQNDDYLINCVCNFPMKLGMGMNTNKICVECVKNKFKDVKF